MSTEAQSRIIPLSDVQVHRHLVFRYYRQLWQEQVRTKWSTLIAKSDAAFRKKFPGNKMDPFGSKLAANLEFLFHRLESCGELIQDVLLYFAPDDAGVAPLSVRPESFRLVVLNFKPLGKSGYFHMA